MSRQIGITIRQSRVEYDPRSQPDGTTANYRSDEASIVEVWQTSDYNAAGGANPGPLNLPSDGLQRVLLATISITSTTTQIDPTKIQPAAQYRPSVGQFGLEGDLPLSVKDSICLLSSKTFGNLEVVPLNSNGPNTSVYVNNGWAVINGRAIRLGNATLQLPPPNTGERTSTLIYLDQNGVLNLTRAVSTQAAATTPTVVGSTPLAEVRWDWNGPYGKTGFSPLDVVDDRPFLCRPGGVQVTRWRTSIVAAANQTVFDLTTGSAGANVRYVPGNNSLNVFWATAGLTTLAGLLGQSAYTEADSTHITLVTPAAAGDVYTFEIVLFDGQ
jgi:hypothetical protein